MTKEKKQYDEALRWTHPSGLDLPGEYVTKTYTPRTDSGELEGDTWYDKDGHVIALAQGEVRRGDIVTDSNGKPRAVIMTTDKTVSQNVLVPRADKDAKITLADAMLALQATASDTDTDADLDATLAILRSVRLRIGSKVYNDLRSGADSNVAKTLREAKERAKADPDFAAKLAALLAGK